MNLDWGCSRTLGTFKWVIEKCRKIYFHYFFVVDASFWRLLKNKNVKFQYLINSKVKIQKKLTDLENIVFFFFILNFMFHSICYDTLV